MIAPTIDRVFIGFIASQLVGFLISKGFLDAQASTQAIQLAETVIGGLVSLVGFIGLFMHHTAKENAKARANTTVVSKTNTSTIETTTPPAPEVQVVPQQVVPPAVVPMTPETQVVPSSPFQYAPGVTAAQPETAN